MALQATKGPSRRQKTPHAASEPIIASLEGHHITGLTGRVTGPYVLPMRAPLNLLLFCRLLCARTSHYMSNCLLYYTRLQSPGTTYILLHSYRDALSCMECDYVAYENLRSRLDVTLNTTSLVYDTCSFPLLYHCYIRPSWNERISSADT